MIRRTFTLIFILSLVLSFQIKAQQRLYHGEKSIRYKVPYHRSGNDIYTPGNTILREMAKVVLKEPWQVHIGVSCKLDLVILRNNGADSLVIRSGGVTVSGDNFFRGFDMDYVLCPTRINLVLKWANRADTTGFSEQELRNLPFAFRDTSNCAIPVASFDAEVDTLIVSGIELYYDSLALGAFMERIELIHNYHASLVLLDSLKALAGDVDFRFPSQLPYNYFRVTEITRVLARIRAIEFPDTSMVPGTDPGGLRNRHRDMFRSERSMTYNFIDELNKSGAIPWDGNTGKLAGFVTSRLLSYIRRSQWMDSLQGTIYHDCLDHYFDGPVFPEEYGLTIHMLRKMYPDALPDTLHGYFARMLYNSMEKSAVDLIAGNRYAEAFDLLDFARKFVSGEPALKDFAHRELLQRQAAEGIFNSYVGIAAGCIKTGKYNMADKYLARADNYARLNPQWVKEDSSYRAVFSELFFIRNTDCDRMLYQEMYHEALDCYLAFEDTYSARDLQVVNGRLEEKKNLARRGLYAETTKMAAMALQAKAADSAVTYDARALALRKVIKGDASIFKDQDLLAPEIAVIRYRAMVDDGTAALQKSQFSLALSTLKEARSLSDQFSIPPAEGFDSIYRRAVKNYLLIRLSVSQKKIWSNQFDSAHADLARTEMAGMQNGLSEDPDLRQAMNRFRNKIREQQCRIIRDSVELCMIRADRGIALRNYKGAAGQFNAALNVVESDTLCEFDAKALKDSLAFYKPPAQYQKNFAEINALIAVGNHPDAIRLLMENEKLFARDGLQRFGLKPLDLYEFIADRDNPFLAESAALMLQKDGRSNEAFRYLAMLRYQGAASGKLTSLQADLGRALASTDHAANHGEDESVALKKYKVFDNWYLAFRRAYDEEWKRLSRP